MKSCSVCGEIKIFAEFSKDKRRALGLSARCKKCRNDIERDRYNNPQYKRKKNEASAAWAKNNADRMIELQRRWDKNNPIKVSAQNARRRARHLGACGKHTDQEWLDLCSKYDNLCLCCQRKDRKLTRDHILPLSKGGSDYIYNIQPLCGPCNSSKHDKHIDYRVDFVLDKFLWYDLSRIYA